MLLLTVLLMESLLEYFLNPLPLTPSKLSCNGVVYDLPASHDSLIKGAPSQFVHLEEFSLNFSCSSFAIRVDLLRP